MITDFIYPFLAVMVVAAAILLTKPLHIHITAKGHGGQARQSSHRLPTPRIGGISLIVGYCVGFLYLPAAAFDIAFLLGASTIPVFIGGLGEDTGFDISPIKRLLLSFASAAFAILLFDVWVQDTGVKALWFLTYGTVMSVAFTIILTGGISHAVNLIDGLNGLAMGVTMMIALGLAGIALSVGDDMLAYVAFLVVAIIAGLFVFNYPLGKIFLGDAGAYSIGHILTWIGILLIGRNPEIAPFSIVLLFFWPIADMLYAIIRRVATGRPVGHPDRLHFHQLTMRGIELVVLGRKHRTISNPLATLFVLPLAGVPILCSQFTYLSDFASVWAFLFFAFGYVATYSLALFVARRFAKTGRRRPAR